MSSVIRNRNKELEKPEEDIDNGTTDLYKYDSHNIEDIEKLWLRYIVIGLIFLLLFILYFIVSPVLYIDKWGEQDVIKYKVIIETLKMIGLFIGGGLGLYSIHLGYKRAVAMENSAVAANKTAEAALRNAEAANKTAEANLKNAQLAEDKQITERYSKAVEQLGSSESYVQLGAIYSLERIAKDSDKDYWNIIEILTTYIREESQKSFSLVLQAALTVIIRRNKSYGLGEEIPIDFIKVNFENLDLTGVNLKRANFSEANLQRANFSKAHLEGANFRKAHLVGANFSGANLENVDFTQTVLFGANFSHANLKNANFQGRYIVNVNFTNADLTDANFINAITWDEEEIDNNSYIEEDFDEECGVDLSREIFYKTNFNGANMRNTNLESANMKGAINLTEEQLEVAKGREKAKFIFED
ncbi:pentapeptide repeat protein [Nostoc sp. NIES-3756]|uniref:pentapeptide repeat-containing protein n=1 Tax=Nostoc sp. NIES-3756 TaxID=1751286 RepID=UPI0007215AAA|nr:pentapeptide repeat-containing protein [Nostoc sp. NIES-3756]BAT52175.1 pentapeptide repeat protein [Nostoc sp. NIES-3756]BAY40125.1 pentapeptide repeat protein [Nostoc sp. NIES-2111]